MLKKNYLFTTFFLISFMLTYAQQDTHFSHYRHHMAIFNPAVTGINDGSFLNLGYKSQWSGVEGAPETQVVSLGMPLRGERAGLGFNVINDVTFVERQTQFFVNFSYKLPLSDDSDLFLGIQGGGNAFRINGNDPKTFGPDGATLTDPLLYDQSQFNPNVGVGIYWRMENSFISLSSPGILNTKRFNNDEGYFTSAADRVHYYLSMGKNFSLSDQWELTPYFLTRLVNNAPIFTSLNTSITNTNGYEIGLEYNIGSGLGGNLLFDIGGISFGYAYTTSIHSEINQFSNGAHEVLLKIKIADKKTFPSKEDTPTNENQIGTENKERINSNRFASR